MSIGQNPAYHKRYVAALLKEGLPLPDGMILKMRLVMAHRDWYAKTAAGWFWLQGDARTPTWKSCPHGPPACSLD